MSHMGSGERDLIVVGGGIAGMTATIYAARAALDVVMLEKEVCGGLANSSWNIENFPSYQSVPGLELMQKIRSHVESYQVAIEEVTEVTHIRVESRRTLIETPSGQYAAKAVIVATGASPIRLPIESDCGERVHYCSLCDGPAYKGRDVIVVGGGNTGFDESVSLVNLGVRSVVIVECLSMCRAEQSIQKQAFSTGRITARTESRLNAVIPHADRVLVTIEHLRSGLIDDVVADGVFVFIGQKPNTSMLEGNVELDKAGYVIADALMHTNRPGVFAAGDVVAKRYRQLTTAMADGTIAALEAARCLRER